MRAMRSGESHPPSRLSRRLGTFDATVIGLGAMIGAGIFAALGPAAEAAGTALLLGLGLAAVVAYCNASSSAQLAALYPRSGGTYVYGRERLGPTWGFLAGWGFVIGKIASCAAMALTFGAYASPDLARPLAVGAVVGLSAVNLLGVRSTARVTRVLVSLVLASLAVVIVASGSGDPQLDRIAPFRDANAREILQAAGLLFFAFAGYARIATLGEEMIDPAHTIPRAIMIALAITLVLYAVVATVALAAVGPQALADSDAPLATAVEAGSLDRAVAVTRIGATVASLGVLLSLLAGVGRTTFSMAAEGDLPRGLAAVHPRVHVPHRAEALIGAIVVIVVLLTDLRSAIGFSSFAVLLYYGIANASALTLRRSERRTPRAVAALGVVGCTVLAFNLPLTSVLQGLVLVSVGLAYRTIALHVQR
jgi:basic amino acid/polyamine antiporter, APA family